MLSKRSLVTDALPTKSTASSSQSKLWSESLEVGLFYNFSSLSIPSKMCG